MYKVVNPLVMCEIWVWGAAPLLFSKQRRKEKHNKVFGAIQGSRVATPEIF